MTHQLIQLKSLGFSFKNRVCFKDFNAKILHGDRIAIIGNNGSGKSSLLKILKGDFTPTDGTVNSATMRVGYVPQIIESFPTVSGGERLIKMLDQALELDPELLLLDEPTNHLDVYHRKKLIQQLNIFSGTLIVASHDINLLRDCVDIFWHIRSEGIYIFRGYYDDYIAHFEMQRIKIESQIKKLNLEKKQIHRDLMREQQRSSKAKQAGRKSIQNHKWPTIKSIEKMSRSIKTSNIRERLITEKRHSLADQLSDIYVAEKVAPKFYFNYCGAVSRPIISITDGRIGYNDHFILEGICFHCGAQDRVAIHGNNGSGKSTFLKSFIFPEFSREGDWQLPSLQKIGYLDQHYSNLPADKTVFDAIYDCRPDWSLQRIRLHLNDFLFRKTESVNTPIFSLSGGEKARLSLALMAAYSPQILILDEVTNNLDQETCAHVIDTLLKYPGALIVVSHDKYFLESINIHDHYQIENKKLIRIS